MAAQSDIASQSNGNRSRPILIVGAGIGGLALAIELLRRGRRPEVVERAGAIGLAGSGIGLAPNAAKCLETLGVYQEVAARGYWFGAMALTDACGRVLRRLDLPEKVRLQRPPVAIHRAELQRILFAAAAKAKFRLGTTVSSIEQRDDGVTVVFSNGALGHYDAVIGCDGLRSSIRALAFSPKEPRYTGYGAWRVIVEKPQRLHFPLEMWGRGKRVGLVPISRKRLYCYATLNAPQRGAPAASDNAGAFKQSFSDFSGFFSAVLAQVERAESLIYTDIEEVKLNAWAKGRVALLGDAAHASTPDLGQGGAMAMEDAIVLAECLCAANPTPVALGKYAALRRRRVRTVQWLSRALGYVGQLESRSLCSVRNRMMGGFARSRTSSNETQA